MTTRMALTAAVASVLFAAAVAIPTDLLDTPAFSREIPPTWWSWPALASSSILAGLLVSSYVAAPAATRDGDRSPCRGGYAGSVLTLFAVGCPVCNKLVLVALGSAGALSWFEPVQPILQLSALALLGWALRRRLAGQQRCELPASTPGCADA